MFVRYQTLMDLRKSNFCGNETDKTCMRGVGIVGSNDNTQYAHLGGHHHDRAVTGLWVVSLHDGKRGTHQISQGASLLASQRNIAGMTVRDTVLVHPRQTSDPHSHQCACLHNPKSLEAALAAEEPLERNVVIRHVSRDGRGAPWPDVRRARPQLRQGTKSNRAILI